MRNRNSVFDMAGPWAGIFSSRVTTQAEQMRQFTVIATVAALVCAGPFAVLDLVNGGAIASLFCASLAVSVVMASLLGRQGRVQTADGVLLAGQTAVAIALSVNSGAMINAGTVVALSAALCGFVVLAKPMRPLALVPLAASAITSVFTLSLQPSLAPAGSFIFALIAALAAVAISLMAVMAARGKAQPRALGPDALEQFEGLVGAVLRYDSTGKLSHISNRGAAFFASRPYEMMGGGLFERIHILDRPHYGKTISDLIETTGETTIAFRVRDDAAVEGSVRYRWVELALAAKADQTGHVSAIGLLRDISAQKVVEDELRASRALAEEASEAKTRFLATIGHELRTPLNAIVGFSDMMAEGIGGTLSATHQDYTGHIRQSGHHLLEVVNMLLDMSKIDAGKFELQADGFFPQSLVDPCLQMVEQVGRERNIAVKTSIPDNLPQLIGDERACRQIMINLLSNAIKFSNDDGVVALGMRRQGKMLAISVSDNGIGMASDTVKRIGEPFLQAQNGLARRYEGTGLGLSIVKGLVGLHGGRMTVASELGVGTRITVLLPLYGPGQALPTATIEHLHKHKPETDEQKWQEDEKRSATS